MYKRKLENIHQNMVFEYMIKTFTHSFERQGLSHEQHHLKNQSSIKGLSKQEYSQV